MEDPIEVQNGFATIKGTRVRVKDIVAQYPHALEDLVVDILQQDYPHLKKYQIRAALGYWRENPDTIEEEIRTEKALFEEASSVHEESLAARFGRHLCSIGLHNIVWGKHGDHILKACKRSDCDFEVHQMP